MSGRGVHRIADLYARSAVDPATRCWHWQGAKSSDGTPRIWTFDHERGEKRCMSGAKAVWNIAHGQAPAGLAYRRCLCWDCVYPGHVSLAQSRAEIGAHIARHGKRKGTYVEQRRANARKAHAASGIVVTPPEIVRAVRADTGTNVAIAARHGIGKSLVSTIRRGEAHRGIA